MKPWEAPYATHDLPGTGGRIRVAAEDFFVEEIPLYEPAGEGEHVYVRLQKTGMATLEAVGRVAATLGLPRRSIGYAGMKDASAVTIQTLSIEGADELSVERLELPGIEVLSVARHRNKLKKGHLLGNRFRITVRDVCAGALERAQAVLDELARRGLPNLFGRQRFGVAGTTHLLGHAVLLGDGPGFFRALLAGVRDGDRALERILAGDIAGGRELLSSQCRVERRALDQLVRCHGDYGRTLRRQDKTLKNLYLAGLQAELFNAVLLARFDSFDRLIEGDLAWLHRNGAVFLVENVEEEAKRAAAFEISPSGPLFGKKTKRSIGQAGRIEQDALERRGLDPDLIRRAMPLRGARRPLRIPVNDCLAESVGDRLTLSFSLPPGSYATVLLREVMKEERPDD